MGKSDTAEEPMTNRRRVFKDGDVDLNNLKLILFGNSYEIDNEGPET